MPSTRVSRSTGRRVRPCRGHGAGRSRNHRHRAAFRATNSPPLPRTRRRPPVRAERASAQGTRGTKTQALLEHATVTTEPVRRIASPSCRDIPTPGRRNMHAWPDRGDDRHSPAAHSVRPVDSRAREPAGLTSSGTGSEILCDTCAQVGPDSGPPDLNGGALSGGVRCAAPRRSMHLTGSARSDRCARAAGGDRSATRG